MKLPVSIGSSVLLGVRRGFYETSGRSRQFATYICR